MVSVFACTYRMCQGAAGCSHCLFNSSCSLMSTCIYHKSNIPVHWRIPSAPPMSCHKVLRSQVKVCIDWMIVPLEENKCVILTALSFSACYSAFICSKHSSHYVNKGNSPEDCWGSSLPARSSRGLLCSWAQNGGHRG